MLKRFFFLKVYPKSSVLFNSREDMHAVEEGKTECGATLSTTRCKKKV